MTCLTNKQNADGTAEMLMDYGAGTLAAETTAALDAHAVGCSACQRLLNTQKQVWQSLDSYTAPQVSADFDRRLYARMALDTKEPAWRRIFASTFSWHCFSQWFTMPVFAGAAACAALAIGFFVLVPEKEIGVSPDQNKKAYVEKVDIDQVEQALEDLDLLAPQPATSPM